MIFLDTETCGLHGPTVLIQWAEDNGPINLHSVWTEPIKDTIELIEKFVASDICGFNLSFDWFHICQTYTTLIQFPDWNVYPEDHINQYAIYEEQARFGPCLKPQGALDLMLHARKGPYQSLMDRNDVRIKKVPTALARKLAIELDTRIPIKDVYFAKRVNRKRRWQVQDITDEAGNIDVDFKDVVLKFAPSSALKALAQDALGYKTEEVKMFAEVEPPKESMPIELGYAPWALAVGKPGDWKGAWPDVGKISVHISHWGYNRLAREYASDDVKYTRELYEFFGRPFINDDDSVLACMVGAVRWRGFAIDLGAIEALKQTALEKLNSVKFNFNSHDVCRRYMEQVLSETEKLVMRVDGKITTKGPILEQIARWKESEVHDACNGQGCHDCEDGLIQKSDTPHPAAVRAQEILDARHAKKEIELYDKLLRAGRFHADLNVIGTRSSRMSGTGGLNAQGIRRAKETRSCFPLADRGLVLCGGDFAGFEVVLADAVYKDPVLREDLTTKRPCPKCKGVGCDDEDCKDGQVDTKIHGLFGVFLFPGMTYDEILATKGLPGEQDKYVRSKNGVFAKLYGGEAYTLVNRVGITQTAADEADREWNKKYKVWGEERKKIFDMFCSMRQPGGIGTKVEWHEPADYIESLFGFRRYFTLENQICKALFELGENPPEEWQGLNIKVTRRDREQTACGAVRSALFAAAFAVQAANMRAAGNHVIQSSGAQITKMLQRKLWDLQPSGIYAWRIQPLNVHDEIMCPHHSSIKMDIRNIVDLFIIEMRPHVPLIAIDWSDRLKNWAEK